MVVGLKKAASAFVVAAVVAGLLGTIVVSAAVAQVDASADPGLVGRIAFVSDRSGSPDIWVMNADGSDPVNLTHDGAVDAGPAWSPDGTRIAFSSNARDGKTDIWVMNADGSNRADLMPTDWSPSNPGGGFPPSWRPAWSPDGKQLAFQDGNGIRVMNADGSNAHTIVPGPRSNNPAWSPDGTTIVYALSSVEFGGFTDLYALNLVAGTPPTDLTNTLHIPEDQPSWSPDGSQIAYWRDGTIGVMDADGGDQHGVTNFNQSDSDPAWSSDGTKIVFSGIRAVLGKPDIFVMDADGGSLVNLTQSFLGSDSEPSWTGLPDMVVTSVGGVGSVVAGDHVVFSATVKNQGTAPTPAGTIVDVAFFVDGETVSWSDTYTSSIPVGGSVTLTANGGPQELGGVPYWVASAGDHTVDAFVNSINRLAESDRSNNHLSQGFSVGELPGEPPGYSSLLPARLLDTRPGSATVDGLFAGVGAVGPGQTLNLTVGGRGGVPEGAGAVALNVTVTGPSAPSFLTVWPTGVARPNASNLNFTPGDTIPNMVIAQVGTNGLVSIYNHAGATDVIVDVLGWFPTGAGYSSLVPARLLDTRAGYSTVDGLFAGVGVVGPGQTLNLMVGGRGGVPAGAGAVALNVTVTNPSAPSFLTVWPTGVARPNASNLNFTPGQTIPNMVIAQVSANGLVSIYNREGTTDVIVDVLGWFPTDEDEGYASLVPARVLDTRPGSSTVDGLFAGVGAVGPAQTLNLTVTGRGGVPASGVGAVALNVTVTGPSAPSFVTVWPTGVAPTERVESELHTRPDDPQHGHRPSRHQRPDLDLQPRRQRPTSSSMSSAGSPTDKRLPANVTDRRIRDYNAPGKASSRNGRTSYYSA